jgi:hypothetical protein
MVMECKRSWAGRQVKWSEVDVDGFARGGQVGRT